MSDGPDNKPTKELPAVPDWAIELTKSVKSGLTKIEADLTGLRADVSLVSNDVANLRDRVILVEGRQNKVDERLDTGSIRAKAISKLDEEQSAALAAEKLAREALAAKVDTIETKTDAQTQVLHRIDGVLGSPTVKRIGQGLAALILLAIAAGTVALNQRIAAMQSKADGQTPVPSVIVVPLFDAGGVK